jgi:hypothetical protein
LVLPGVLAAIAGFVFLGAVIALLVSVLGSILSFLGSIAASVLGGLVSIFATLALVACFVFSFPVLLVILIPIGLLVLIGGLFCTVICGIA